MMDDSTGELTELRLGHESGEARPAREGSHRAVEIGGSEREMPFVTHSNTSALRPVLLPFYFSPFFA